MRRRRIANGGARLVAAAACVAPLIGGCSTPAPAPTQATASIAPEWVESRVDASGVSLIVWCKGEARDRPPVVFVSGLALDATSGWVASGVPDRVATKRRACVYDRAGLGRSGPDDEAPTVAHQTDHLSAVVTSIGGPVVLAAQGYGTFIARLFADETMHLDQTAGLVLIDPPLWSYPEDVPEGITDGQRAEYDSIVGLNDEIFLYGAGAMPSPPIPLVVVGADGTKPWRPDGPPPPPGTTRPPKPDATNRPNLTSPPTINSSTTTSPTTTAPPATDPPDGDPSDTEAPADGPTSTDAATETTATPEPTDPPVGDDSSTTAAPDPEGSAPVTEPVTTPTTLVGTTVGTVSPIIAQADREWAQQLLAGKSPFGRFEAMLDAGSEVQFWFPDRIADLILGLETP